MADADLNGRLTSLELAVTALAEVVLSNGDGHPFYGNQWTGGGGGGLRESSSREKQTIVRSSEKRAGSATDRKPTDPWVIPGGKPPPPHVLEEYPHPGANAKPGDTTGGKGTDAARYESALAEGMIPPHVENSGYGSSLDQPAAVLPTGPGSRLNPRDMADHEYHTPGEGVTILRSNETGHLRALDHEPSGAFQPGATVHLQHDQSGARIGGYGGHDVVGAVYDDGKMVGLVPDKKLPYAVFK